MVEIKTLHQRLIEEFGKRTIEKTDIPSVITSNLNPVFSVRPYQTRAFQFFLNYWQEPFEGKPRQNHQLLFHMATGSGKTMMMAGLILHMYSEGYRNFLFFVNSTNIIDKTRDNFLNPLSGKYLFAPKLSIGDKQFLVREANNFQSTNPDDINIVFSTIQGLHMALNTPRENALTYDDFESQKIVMISDEAHHINADTKKGDKLTQEELFESVSWESTVQRIFEANPKNILLEFTATVDFSDPNLAAKYKPLLIFDYTLKEFRKDGYSKEVKVLQADLPSFDRALQAILLSQYRRKIFEKNKLAIKPVILFKSKTIKDSKAFFEEFKASMESLTANRIAKVLGQNDPSLQAMAAYLQANGVTLDNLATELRGDFTEDKLIEVNSKEESDTKQLAVNSLETTNNEYRAVFAVDKLNEGWDVLNLFDIVRLYDTRDSKANKIGKTTMSEAQLIGRGARYCPFKLSSDDPPDQRKFDFDLTHELRICEELIYHSAYNPKYIQELNSALHEIGIKAKDTRQRSVKLKSSFKATPLYKAGHLFLNEQYKYDRSEIKGLESSLIQKLYKVQLHTGYSQSMAVFADQNGSKEAIKRKVVDFSLAGFGLPILRKAMQRLEFYEFENLKRHLPNLKSSQEFLTSSHYMGNIKVEVSGAAGQVESLSAYDRLYAATKVLKEASAGIASDKIEYKGTKDFKPFMLKDKITDKTLNFAFDEGEDQEFGRSMNNPNETAIHLDLSTRDWFIFNDCYGTSEEKLLIKYIDKNYDDLKKRYTDVYLIRNERHFKIYAFDDGRPLEPDFILYLIGKEKNDTLHYQIFIEPKGGHLLKQDEWKESFLQRLKAESVIEQLWKNRKYAVWGLPFFNEAQRMPEFDSHFSKLLPKERV
ncbi:MAG: DEAD/DEAH box helicase family protein [Nitrospira sp.]|nr:DEAD/DEAH box helicase family protein [Nitrospira sp.]